MINFALTGLMPLMRLALETNKIAGLANSKSA